MCPRVIHTLKCLPLVLFGTLGGFQVTDRSVSQCYLTFWSRDCWHSVGAWRIHPWPGWSPMACQTSSHAVGLSWGSRRHPMAMPLLGLMHSNRAVSATVLLDKTRFAAFQQKRAELILSLFCALPYLWGFGKRQYRRWADGHFKIKVDNERLIRHTVT